MADALENRKSLVCSSVERPQEECMILSLVGASGSGKTTIARELLGLSSYARMLGSVTTRVPRPSDLPGEYEYIDAKLFAAYMAQDVFEWTVSIHGSRYGTRRTSLDRGLLSGDIEIMMLVPDAMERLWKYAKGLQHKVKPFFINTPSEEELRRRLTIRGDSEEDIARRVVECRDWGLLARESLIPYCMVSNQGDPGDIARIIASMV